MRHLVISAKHLGLPNNQICNVMRPQEAFQHLNVTDSRKLNIILTLYNIELLFPEGSPPMTRAITSVKSARSRK